MIKELERVAALLAELQGVVTKLIEQQNGGPIKRSIESIVIPLTCQEFSVTEEQFFGKTRPGRIAMARHAAAGIIKENSDYNFADIARIFHKTHGAIRNNLAQFQDCQVNPFFLPKVNRIRLKLKGLIT